MSARAQFTTKVRELIAQAKTVPPAVSKQVLEMLDAARKEIVAKLAALDPNSFSHAQLSALKQSIDQSFDLFRQRATNYVNAMQQQAAQLGAQSAAQPLVSAGLEAVALGRVNTTTLAIAQNYTADLITNLSAKAAHDINATLQRAFLGGQSMTDILQQIGTTLGEPGKVNIFDALGARAESIAVNEILRVHAMSTQARMEEMADRHPDLKKQWKHIPAARWPRISHLLADGQIKNVTEPFEIAPAMGAATEELMFPRDPAGTARNTINCHCLATPYFDKDALKPTESQKQLLQNIGVSVTAA